MAKCVVCGKDANAKVGNNWFCPEHYTIARFHALPGPSAEKSTQTPPISQGTQGQPKSQQTPMQTAGGGGAQRITQEVRFVPPASLKSVVIGIIFLFIGFLLLNFLLSAVKIGNRTAGEFIWANIYPIIAPILAYSAAAGFIIIFVILLAIVFAIFRNRRYILSNLVGVISALNAAVWIPSGILMALWVATFVSPYAPTQLYCMFVTGDIARCSTQQQPVANAEPGVFESPVRIEYGIYDYVNNKIIPVGNPTAGQIYYPTITLRPNTNYESEVKGLVINMIAKNVNDERIDFIGSACTPTSTCSITENIPITVSFESIDLIPCQSKFLTLYSQIYYPIEGARNGYHVRLVRSDEDMGMSLANDISKASKIYGPVDFALGFSPGQHIVIPKSGTGKMIVYIYASNEYRGVASLKNMRLVQEPERSGNNIYKLNLVSCDPIMPSINQDSKGNIYYVFDTPIEIKPSQAYQSAWQVPSQMGTTAVKRSQIVCTFEIPFSLRETSYYYKTVTFHIGGSYSYSEEVQSEPITVWDTC